MMLRDWIAAAITVSLMWIALFSLHRCEAQAQDAVQLQLTDELESRWAFESSHARLLDMAKEARTDHERGMTLWLVAVTEGDGRLAQLRIAKAALLLKSAEPLYVWGHHTTDLFLDPERRDEALPLFLLAAELGGGWARKDLAVIYTTEARESADLDAFKTAALELQP